MKGILGNRHKAKMVGGAWDSELTDADFGGRSGVLKGCTAQNEEEALKSKSASRLTTAQLIITDVILHMRV
jgi:hypothetical protein